MKMVALLRGVNVGGNRKVPMPELCALAARSGLREVAHYINSGNLVFEAGKLKPEQVAATLEGAIEKRFGFQVEVIVCTATQWKRFIVENPFATAARLRPNLLHLGLSKLPFEAGAIVELKERATLGELIRPADKAALWIDFPKGVGKSKLTPAVLDRAIGSTVTLRNFNTVLKLGEMLNAPN